jgi:hypothetical protein
MQDAGIQDTSTEYQYKIQQVNTTRKNYAGRKPQQHNNTEYKYSNTKYIQIMSIKMQSQRYGGRPRFCCSGGKLPPYGPPKDYGIKQRNMSWSLAACTGFSKGFKQQ